MKLNHLCKLLAFISLITVAHAQSPIKIHDRKVKIIVIKVDTIRNQYGFSIRTILKCGHKTIELINKFLKDGRGDGFSTSMKNYLGLTAICDGKAINNFKSFATGICDYSIPFFEDFKGDSIDNEYGFNCKELITGNDRYLLLQGYFSGCNGSFCNNGVLLILRFQNNILSSGSLIGIDKSIYDLSKIQLLKNNKSIEVLLINFKRKPILLLLKNQVETEHKLKNKLSQLGLFCIKNKI